MSTRVPESEPVLRSAAAVVPVEGPPVLRGGAVVSGQTIVRVGAIADLRHEFPGVREESWNRHVLLPGLVNAHCHLELGWLRGRLPAGHFVDWVQGLIRASMALADRTNVVAGAARAAMDESLRFGVTTVGDITRHAAITRQVLRPGPLRVVSFGEVAGMGARRWQAVELLAAAADRGFDSSTLQAGISPHAPYTVEGPVLSSAVERALAGHLPVTMHLAELREEVEFLSTCGGRLREVWQMLGNADELLDASIPRFAGGPLRWAQHWGLFDLPRQDVPVALGHVNYCDDEELAILAPSGVSVVYCPRTRAFFGHEAIRLHRFRDMLAAGINVALGTDSLASNPDLSILREGQFLRGLHPDTPAATLLDMMTLRAARALGMAEHVGSLVSGKQADIIALELPETALQNARDLPDAIIALAPHPAAVWIAGHRVH